MFRVRKYPRFSNVPTGRLHCSPKQLAVQMLREMDSRKSRWRTAFPRSCAFPLYIKQFL